MKTLCKICGKLVTKKNILRHVQSHGDANFTCNICDKHFSTRDYQHTKTHWQPQKLKCSLCSSSFFSRSSLRKHRIRVHERKRFQCPYCQKNFTKEDYCQQHILTCRCSTPVKCSSCDKTFKNSIALYFHVKLIDKYCRFCK